MNALGTARFFAEALSRERPLTDTEIDKLCRVQSIERQATGQSLIRRWAATEDARLRRLLRTTKTAIEIAEMMGRSPAAIRSRIRELKKMKRDKRRARDA